MPDYKMVAGLVGMSKKLVIALGLLLVGIWLSADIANAAIHIPKGCTPDVFLTISGKIGRTTNSANNAYEMSEREFLALPTSTVATSTPWTPKSDFTGPLLSKVLGEVGATGKTLRLIALDDFSVEVDADYLEKYGTILATSKDGVRLTIRDFGPVFVMYPRDSFGEELDTPAASSYLVWQLCGIDVE
ncbi:oxidoreductase [Agrobacterium rhizogenes]|uniref:oxidoreductase n=1 Tax=Rhizobium rhizogenes TaxID=359 RepID=UPI00103B9B86|nr:oxidoreductase [Rhizobium rhizogenes]NTI19912.1 oxidoreductase [Rhizobium rhizogenes]QRM40597.1 oxidoreductase [Rhizobium rhizogenes]